MRAGISTAWMDSVAQFVKFGVVGGSSTVLHVATFVSLIELVEFGPIVANSCAFAAAFALSFFGHYRWTFDNSRSGYLYRQLRRFLCVSLAGFGLNSLVVYVVSILMSAPHLYAAGAMLTIVPVAVFLASKFWAFK